MSEYDSTSRPVETYRFEISGYDPMLFTSDERAVTAEGDLYEALDGLSRSGLGVATLSRESDLAITVPATCLLARRLGLLATPQEATVTFRRYQRSDLNTPTMRFSSQLAGASLSNDKCVLKFSDVFRVGLASKIPRSCIQTQCNWRLGDVNCGKNLAELTANVDQIAQVYHFSSIVAGKYTLQASWADGVDPYDPLFWVGGVITGVYGDVTERRTIFKIAFIGGEVRRFELRAQIELNRSFDIPLAGATFTITPGCDNSFTRCAALQNTLRFSGFPYVPTEQADPFEAQLDHSRKI